MLCSRIGVMVNGKMACLGTASHLTAKYGRGYHLELNATSASGQQQGAILRAVQAVCPQAAVTGTSVSVPVCKDLPARLYSLDTNAALSDCCCRTSHMCPALLSGNMRARS